MDPVRFEPTVPLMVPLVVVGGVRAFTIPESEAVRVVAFVLEKVRLPLAGPGVPLAAKRTNRVVLVRLPPMGVAEMI